MSDEARTVLAAFRRATKTTAAQHAATWTRIQARIDADDEPRPLDVPNAPQPLAARRSIAIGLAIAAAVALAVWAWSWRDAALRGEDAARSQAIDDAAHSPTLGHAAPAPGLHTGETSPRASPVATTSATAGAEPVPLQRPTMLAPPPTPAAGRTTAPPPVGSDALAREVALMQSAREAALAGAHARAIELTDAHASEFPRGKLAHERWALRIDLLCRLDRRDAARATALGFASAYPDSTLAAERRTTPCPNKP